MTIDQRDAILFDAIREALLHLAPVAASITPDDEYYPFHELEKCIAVLAQAANIRWYWLDGGHTDMLRKEGDL